MHPCLGTPRPKQDQSKMSTSTFTALPQDALQHVINRFLDPVSRANFNAVLKPDERVHKKMPTDFAIAFDIEVKRSHYEGIAKRLQFRLNRLDWGGSHFFDWESSNPARAEKELRKMFAFFQAPSTAIIFAHKEKLGPQMARMVGEWTEADNELYSYMRDGGAELKALAAKTRDIILSRPFVRQVHFAQRVFL
ncbi:MAG: hypothetical protein EBR81_11955 [Proteobacteria bacterium]|nr:hypothetical protein [Pseudomonadota bacterium]